MPATNPHRHYYYYSYFSRHHNLLRSPWSRYWRWKKHDEPDRLCLLRRDPDAHYAVGRDCNARLHGGSGGFAVEKPWLFWVFGLLGGVNAERKFWLILLTLVFLVASPERRSFLSYFWLCKELNDMSEGKDQDADPATPLLLLFFLDSK